METEHTIELLERRVRPKGSAYTVRHCDEGDCHARATYLADGSRFLCTHHATGFCQEHALDLPVLVNITPQPPPARKDVDGTS